MGRHDGRLWLYGSSGGLCRGEGFRRQGVTISLEEARGPMGMEKRAHIETLGAMPRIAEAWLQRHGQPMQHSDVDAMYDDFLPLLLAVLDQHADVIPGVIEVVEALGVYP